MIVLRVRSSSNREFCYKFQKLGQNWCLINFTEALVSRIIREPSVPSEGMVLIGNCKVYLGKVPKISRNRILLEIICLMDLYYHDKKCQKTSQPYVYTAVSEESYLQYQLIIKNHSIKPELKETFRRAMDEYVEKVRWTENALRVYDPNGNYIFFSNVYT